MNSLQTLIAQESLRFQVIEILGIANPRIDPPSVIAEKCIAAEECPLSDEHCIHLFKTQPVPFLRILQESSSLVIPRQKELFEVHMIRLAWNVVLSDLRPMLREAMHIDEFKKSLRGMDPIQGIENWLTREYDVANANRQRDLKPVINILSDESDAILLGLSRLAAMLCKDKVAYAEHVASSCCNPTIVPQKGLRFAVTLLARAGDARIPFEKSFERNLRTFLCGEPSVTERNFSTAAGRVSETKTVLAALGLAASEKGKHHNVPQFSADIKEFLLRLTN